MNTEDTLNEHGSYHSPVHDALDHEIDNLRLTKESISEIEADAAIEALISARRTLVLGFGSYAGPAGLLAHLGTTMGYSIAHEPRGSVHLASALNTMGPDDLLVIVNMWRTNKTSTLAAEAVRELGAKVLAITDMRESLISEAADHLLVVPSEGISFFQSVTAATSVIYGLLAGMETANTERSRQSLRGIQKMWKELEIYSD
ncbi:MurR/RpiR family transcriptional regulator [Brevibacterium zhoupengii]|uniref:MurR/RpiR family transcriptional regulator n=1 Tax=Brevibacterium zhoupengii TaxID=2898795 RepID=UPI001E582698|nr:MurR/RpiR family transcriptional regulator [Brevibacterium zhoupengii]